ncbi:hypothetical protein [uncultured Shimia sp.]|uniref:hypothetical protein n=1 Tax=uncultured Shimia sp. TaxID=573152 RepID=UPI002635E325|nr:hypothetical protein [uncultured Shimia sp.]
MFFDAYAALQEINPEPEPPAKLAKQAPRLASLASLAAHDGVKTEVMGDGRLASLATLATESEPGVFRKAGKETQAASLKAAKDSGDGEEFSNAVKEGGQSEFSRAVKATDEKYPYGRAVAGSPRTWTGKVVSLAEWRELSEWDKHGNTGKHWSGLTRQWEDAT